MRIRVGTAAVAALVLVLAGCGSDGDSDAGGDTPSASASATAAGIVDGVDEITVSVFTNSPVSTIDQMVVRMGFLEEEGVKAELLEIPSGPDMVASLLGGSAQVTGGAPALAYPLLAQGECLKYLAPGQGNMYSLIARADADLPNVDKGFPESVRDLKGKTIGVVARGSATEVWMSAVLRDAGLDPAADVTFIAVGGGATALPAFQQKTVDVMIGYPPLLQQLEKQGLDYKVVADMVNGDPDTLDQMLQVGSLVTCKFAEQNPDTVDAYCRAVDKAYAFLRDEDNAEEMGAFMSEILAVDAETGAEIWDGTVKKTFPSDTFTEEIFEAQVEFLPTLTEAPDYGESVLTDCG